MPSKANAEAKYDKKIQEALLEALKGLANEVMPKLWGPEWKDKFTDNQQQGRQGRRLPIGLKHDIQAYLNLVDTITRPVNDRNNAEGTRPPSELESIFQEDNDQLKAVLSLRSLSYQIREYRNSIAHFSREDYLEPNDLFAYLGIAIKYLQLIHTLNPSGRAGKSADTLRGYAEEYVNETHGWQERIKEREEDLTKSKRTSKVIGIILVCFVLCLIVSASFNAVQYNREKNSETHKALTRAEGEVARLKDANGDLSRTVKGLKREVNVLEEILKKGPPYPQPLSEIRKDICAWYKKWLDDGSPETFQKLKDKCLLYSKLDAKEGTTFFSYAQKLLKWMDAAEQGEIQIIPTTFEESAQWGWSHYNSIVMKYRFSQGDKKCKSWKCYFHKEENLSGNPERYPSLNVPWIPGGGDIVIEVEQLDGEKVSKKGKKSWPITSDIIRKSDDELLKPQELKTEDADYRFYYTIRRKGFGPIPKPPDWAK